MRNRARAPSPPRLVSHNPGSRKYYINCATSNWSRDPRTDTGSPAERRAVRAGQVAELRRPIVASADVGPDLIVPWRRPSLVILYTKHAIDPTDLKLVSAQGPHDANVILRMPEDRSVFPFAALVAQVQGNDVPLADPLQQIWDLQDLGGADRLEAAGRLRQWLLARH